MTALYNVPHCFLVPYNCLPLSSSEHFVTDDVNLLGFRSCATKTENKFLETLGAYHTLFNVISYLPINEKRIVPFPNAVSVSVPAALVLYGSSNF